MYNTELLRDTIGLILTYRCNLSCTYCYIPEKRDITIPFETVKNLLAPKLSIESEDCLFIEFMGAEPLAAFERLREIVEWVKNSSYKRKYMFFATTNGTLLDEDKKAWFRENSDKIVLCLSYDGTDQTQDNNRSRSSKRIDKQFFKDTWPNQAFKCTIPEHAVNRLAEGIISLVDNGFSVRANPACEDHEWNQQSIQEYERQLRQIVDYYDKNPDKPMASIVNHDLVAIYKARGAKQTGICGAKFGEGVYDVSGKSYPCHVLSPLVLDDGSLREAQSILLNSEVDFEDPRCKDCVLKNGCPTCMAFNYILRNDFAKRDLTRCQTYRLEVLATCLLQKNRLLQKKELDEQDRLLAKAICEICKRLVEQ